MKIPVLLLLPWAAQQSEAREVFRSHRSLELRPSGRRWLALVTVFGS
jgi:hypothetical protein